MTTSAQTQRGRNRLGVLVALSLAAFIISLDVTIVNVALPTLVRTLGATTTQLQWVVDAYSLVFAAFVLAAGSLSDRQGRKGTLLVGLAVFASGSLAGALVDTTTELIAARGVDGPWRRPHVPVHPFAVGQCLHRARRARQGHRALGCHDRSGDRHGSHCGWLAVGALLVGKHLRVHGWSRPRHWTPRGLTVPSSRDPLTPPIDWRGFGLSSVAMGVLILGVIEAPDWGWASAAAVSTMTAGVILLILFVLFELRTDHPMLDVSLFRNPRFTAASGSVAISFFALQGFIFLITQYFQFIKAFSPLGTGVRLLPVASAVAVTSVVGTKLAVRIGNKAIVSTGLLSFATGLLWTATVSASTSYTTIVFQMLLLGTGMGLTSAPATEAIMGAVPKAKAGVGSAVNDATRLFGGTLGVAVIGSIAASLYSSHWHRRRRPICRYGPSLQQRSRSVLRSLRRAS